MTRGLVHNNNLSDLPSAGHARINLGLATIDLNCICELFIVNAIFLARQFYQFALGCGYAHQSMVMAPEMMAEEYGQAYCRDGRK
jgi:hypothetical protein